ncbi:MAG: DsbA family protein [Burkholderiaceae bacterium]
MDWYFDFISPYAYLQSTKLEVFEEHQPVRCVPVLFAGLLNHFGNIGPAELAPKRQWTFEQVAWLAHQNQISLQMPAHHPFNPLALLRLSIAAGATVEVVQRIFRFVWAEGYNPDDEAAFSDLCAEFGLEPGALQREEIKQTLRHNTESAVGRGVFGVPTIAHKDKKFWGFDSTEMALAYFSANGNEAIYPAAAIDAAQAMPNGTARRNRGKIGNFGNLGNSSAATAVPEPPANKKPRIDYLPEDLAEPAEIVQAVRERRGGHLIELDRMLLYSPNLARGWNHLLGAVRNELDLSKNLRELAMCTVAVINRAEYEFTHHLPIYIETGGSEAQAQALRDPDAALASTQLFSETERAALGLCIDMTRTVQVNQSHFDACERLLGRQQLVELIATIAAYNMVSRFLVALNVQPDHE